MKIRALMFSFLLVAVSPLPAQADCPGQSGSLRTLGKQTLTVSSTAVGPTLPTTGVLRRTEIMVEANPIRFWDDGTAPTASVGKLVQANTPITVCGAIISGFLAIRTGSDATLSIIFYGD